MWARIASYALMLGCVNLAISCKHLSTADVVEERTEKADIGKTELVGLSYVDFSFETNIPLIPSDGFGFAHACKGSIDAMSTEWLGILKRIWTSPEVDEFGDAKLVARAPGFFAFLFDSDGRVAVVSLDKDRDPVAKKLGEQDFDYVKGVVNKIWKPGECSPTLRGGIESTADIKDQKVIFTIDDIGNQSVRRLTALSVWEIGSGDQGCTFSVSRKDRRVRQIGSLVRAAEHLVSQAPSYTAAARIVHLDSVDYFVSKSGQVLTVDSLRPFRLETRHLKLSEREEVFSTIHALAISSGCKIGGYPIR